MVVDALFDLLSLLGQTFVLTAEPLRGPAGLVQGCIGALWGADPARVFRADRLARWQDVLVI